jgi:hypothetical protein
MVDFQHWFEVVITLLGVVGGWFLKVLWSDTKELTSKVQQIELLVAGEYIKKTEFERFTESIFHKLDRIEEKIDKKADK